MGGHGHEVKTPPVPDASTFKVEDSYLLTKLQKRLEKEGLKDPWIRNYVWRTPKHQTKWYEGPFIRYFIKGWQIWIPLVGLTIAVENFLGIDYHGHHHNEHDDHH